MNTLILLPLLIPLALFMRLLWHVCKMAHTWRTEGKTAMIKYDNYENA